MGQSKEQFMNEQEQDQNIYLSRTEVLSPALNLVISKTGAAEFHKKMRERILSTGSGAAQYVEVIKFFAKLNDEVFGNQYKDGDKDFRKSIMEEIAQNGKEMTTARGVKFELAETGTKYDYSLNPEWVDLDRQAREATEKRKALEERLKVIPAGKVLVDQDTGETLIGPGKTSNSSFKITLPK